MKKTFQDILKEKLSYYGDTEAAYEFAAEEYANEVIKERQIEIFIEGYKSASEDLISSFNAVKKRAEINE